MGDSVYLVVGNYAGDPHPHVEGVYDNPDVAKRHEQAIANASGPGTPIAWDTHEVEIRSTIVEGPVCGSDDYRTEDRGRTLDDRARCRDCQATWRNP